MNNNSSKIKRDLKVAVLVIICIMLNYYGKKLAIYLSLPLWLDSIGTAISAYVLGPICGAIIGISVNVLYAAENFNLIYYGITSIAIGVVIGNAARKNLFESAFKASSVAALLTIVATIVSTPVNCIFFEGYVYNVWADGFFEMLKEWEINWILASTISEIMIEFMDKLLTLLILYLVIVIRRKYIKKNNKEKKNSSVAAILVIVFTVNLFATANIDSYAADNTESEDYNSYIQTIYSNNNGLPSGEANDIVATNDGILWIATYAGLYRYNGTEFSYMNQYSTVKNANDLYVDVEGRLWIGTNDNGLSILINGEVINTLDETNGLPSNSVRSIVQQSSGNYFIGTSSDLAIVSISGGIQLVGKIPEIKYAKSLTADANNHVVAVTSDGELFLINDMEVKDTKEAPEGEEYFTCCLFDSNESLYVGTETGSLLRYKVVDDKLVYETKYKLSEVTTINSIYESKPNEIIICGESGIACMNNGRVSYISVGNFNSSIERMTIDYQGNLWFSSSRLGIMKMCKTAFAELYQEYNLPDTVVNTVVKWNGDYYCGTDSGLDILKGDSTKAIQNELTNMLENTRVRCAMVDSSNKLWICTYGKGVICVDTAKNIIVYDSSSGISGNRFRHALELSDKTIAVSNDKGVAFIKDGKVIDNVGEEDGLSNSVVLCLYEKPDGSILAGTDGGGINVIKNGKVDRVIGSSDGLGSAVILRLSEDKDSNGVFITTSNGIDYLNEDGTVKHFTNIPYSNNYDVYDLNNGRLLVPGSAGIYIIEKESLMSGGEASYEILDYTNGLRGSLTANAWNYVENESDFYFANGTGVTLLKLDNLGVSSIAYRMLLSNITIDDKAYRIDRNEKIIIPRDAKVIELRPEIINYSTNDPYIRYYMQGLIEDPVVVRESELGTITYTNIKSGEYKFILSILEDGRVVEEQTYTLVKEKKIYDNTWFKLYFLFELILIIAWFSWFVTRTTIGHKLDRQKKELELARKQVDMGNETILAIAKTVDAKDENTSQHSIRVSEYSKLIAERLGYSEEDCENLRKAALLHDIGKIGIPDSVLNKPGRLTDEEYVIMKSHVTRGAEILKDFTLIPNVQLGALYHHERYDGKGYAHGLKGEEIPEWARIIGIADAFDAMTANRVYRKQLEFDYVIEEIKKGRGTQFDPRMADIMLQLIDEGVIDVDELYGKRK